MAPGGSHEGSKLDIGTIVLKERNEVAADSARGTDDEDARSLLNRKRWFYAVSGSWATDGRPLSGGIRPLI